jgi:hypothetical protein
LAIENRIVDLHPWTSKMLRKLEKRMFAKEWIWSEDFELL